MLTTAASDGGSASTPDSSHCCPRRRSVGIPERHSAPRERTPLDVSAWMAHASRHAIAGRLHCFSQRLLGVSRRCGAARRHDRNHVSIPSRESSWFSRASPRVLSNGSRIDSGDSALRPRRSRFVHEADSRSSTSSSPTPRRADSLGGSPQPPHTDRSTPHERPCLRQKSSSSRPARGGCCRGRRRGFRPVSKRSDRPMGSISSTDTRGPGRRDRWEGCPPRSQIRATHDRSRASTESGRTHSAIYELRGFGGAGMQHAPSRAVHEREGERKTVSPAVREPRGWSSQPERGQPEQCVGQGRARPQQVLALSSITEVSRGDGRVVATGSAPLHAR